MKLYATIENERGKREGIGGNEWLDIDIRVGNQYLARFTVKEYEDGKYHLFDENDVIVPQGKGKAQSE